MEQDVVELVGFLNSPPRNFAPKNWPSNLRRHVTRGLRGEFLVKANSEEAVSYPAGVNLYIHIECIYLKHVTKLRTC